MAERKRHCTIGDKQEEECTSGHKKNLEGAENCEAATGFEAQGLLLLAHSFICLTGFCFYLRKFHVVQASCGGLNEMCPQVSAI